MGRRRGDSKKDKTEQHFVPLTSLVPIMSRFLGHPEAPSPIAAEWDEHFIRLSNVLAQSGDRMCSHVMSRTSEGEHNSSLVVSLHKMFHPYM